MVRILWDLLHRRSLIFYHGGEAYTRRVGVKGQKSLDADSVFLSDLGLSISTTNSEVVLFSKRPVESPPSLTMGGIGLPISKEFKYLGVVFDWGLTWNAHTRYVLKRCKKRINFMNSIAGTA
jgi:hypothetical protein